jgi:hypothetical protein
VVLNAIGRADGSVIIAVGELHFEDKVITFLMDRTAVIVGNGGGASEGLGAYCAAGHFDIDRHKTLCERILFKVAR